jgi:hypothetical protein
MTDPARLAEVAITVARMLVIVHAGGIGAVVTGHGMPGELCTGSGVLAGPRRGRPWRAAELTNACQDGGNRDRCHNRNDDAPADHGNSSSITTPRPPAACALMDPMCGTGTDPGASPRDKTPNHH